MAHGFDVEPISVKLELRVPVRDDRTAQMIIRSLSPDDVNLPGQLKIMYFVNQGSLIISLRGNVDLFKLKGTVNDIFLSLKPILKIISRLI